MRLFLPYLLFLLLCLSACSSDELIDGIETSCQTENTSNPYRISINDAARQVAPLLEILDHGGNTRSECRVISDVQYITTDSKQSTRTSTIIDTLLYVVNFENNQGFAILGADKRVPAILAISNTGNFNYADTVFNKAFALCVESLIKKTSNTAQTFSDFNPVDSTYKPPHISDRVVEVITHIPPHLQKFPSHWGQGAPYNYRCAPYNNITNYKVGCGPLAVAQIMTYYEWPKQIDALTLNWNEIKSWDDTFMSLKLGKENLLQMLYSVQQKIGAYPEASTGHTLLTDSQFSRNFYKLGYKAPGSPKSYGSGSLDALKKGPLLISAKVQNEQYGHMWVIDGYILYKETWDALVEGSRLYSLHHCVWGWDGANNGYYAFNSDGTLATILPDEYAPEDSESYDFDCDYTVYNLKYWGDFQPVK